MPKSAPSMPLASHSSKCRRKRSTRACTSQRMPRRPGRRRLFRHALILVRLFEIKRKAHHIPAALERPPVFRVSGIFEDFDPGNVLPQKAQPKRDSSRHAKAPRESFGRIFAEVVVEPKIAVNGGKEHSNHGITPSGAPGESADPIRIGVPSEQRERGISPGVLLGNSSSTRVTRHALAAVQEPADPHPASIRDLRWYTRIASCLKHS